MNLFQNTVTNVAFLVVMVVLYFLPAIVAKIRRHHNALAIALFTLLLGWTGICWLAALIWSVTAVHPRSLAPREQ